jgi:hypothetical protein
MLRQQTALVQQLQQYEQRIVELLRLTMLLLMKLLLQRTM